MSDNGTPGWLRGLIVVFAITTLLTFGLFLYRHAEDASLRERYRNLRVEQEELKIYVPKLSALVGGSPSPMDSQILVRRQKIKDLGESMQQTMGDVNRLVAEAQVHQQSAAKAMGEEAKRYVQLLNDAKARRNDLKTEEEHALTLERTLDERRVTMREQLEVASRELETLKRSARNDNVDKDVRLDELDSRIRQLSQQRELNNRELRPDGRILSSRATDGFVVIDRGQDHNLRKGTRFVVYNRRGGKLIVKGNVEVVEIEARMSVCRVTAETNASDPLLPGDLIHNPVYNPIDVKVFVIKGDFVQYSAEELARFITEAGGKVAKEITTSTDYLVAGERTQPDLDKATKIGVSILSEVQLLELVRRHPKDRIGSGVVVVLKGRFSKVSAGAVESLIERSGGVVQSAIEPGVDMLIAGENCADDIAKAHALGIKVIDHTGFTYLNDKN